MRGALLVCGTGSDVGKSVVVAGICRWLHRRGVKVAPFKAQNMSLNSVVTVDGGEIGRAQAAQAAACGLPPETAMNPVLIKPTGERHSQVVVLGRPSFETDARSYRDHTDGLRAVTVAALADLRARFDVVICEGAGSISEINLRGRDLANLGLARAANLPVVVVGDIDRGGIFGALYGNLALLDPADQAHVAAFVINRFRGDPTVLAPALTRLERLTARPVLGVLPHRDGLWLDAEDSLALDAAGWSRTDGGGSLDVAVVRLPRISNFTDVDPLTAEPDVEVRFTTGPTAIARADLVVVPGSKATVDDLAWLRRTGLADVLAERVRRTRPVLGVCGGYQLLGRRIVDEVECRAGMVDGLGILPVETVFHPDKHLSRPTGSSPFLGGVPAFGYEIRHGRVTVHGGEPLVRTTDGQPEGCVVGAAVGTSWHGLLEGDELRRAFLAWVAERAGRPFTAGSRPFATVREARLDTLGELVGGHLDSDALTGLLTGGASGGLPVIPPAGAPPEVAP